MTISVKTLLGGYNIELESGVLARAKDYINLNRKVAIVTDSGVPKEYSEVVAKQCKESIVITVEQGEKSKNFDNYSLILKTLVDNGFTRSDCVVAVGGGVIGDMAGFSAASFMRGIDFYNIPTTLLSQVDSSIGGKTAIDFCGVKNIVGAFYQPKCVLIDPDTLKTLPERHISNGLAESIKMAMTFDKELFELIETKDIEENLNEIIYRSLNLKKNVVEQDEKESGLRKTLNFGHTVGHAIESMGGFEDLLHGECVALGMTYFTDKDILPRLKNVLKKAKLPFEVDAPAEKIVELARHDKKKSGDKISVVTVEKIGEFILKDIPFEEFEETVRKVVKF